MGAPKPQQILVQGNVTMVVGGTPVLALLRDVLLLNCLPIINFLRAGCSTVQLSARGDRQVATSSAASLRRLLAAISLAGEKFLVSPPQNIGDENEWLVTVTRTFAAP